MFVALYTMYILLLVAGRFKVLKRLVCHNELVDPKKEREGEEVSFQRLFKRIIETKRKFESRFRT